MTRKPYPRDVSADELAFVASYLTLMTEDAPQREHPLREVFNGLRWIVRAGAPWRMLPNDLPPWEAVYQQTRALAQRRGVRGHGQRLAPTLARGCRTKSAALGGDF